MAKLAVSLIALALLAGCDHGNRVVGASDDERAAAGAVTGWLKALVAGDDARACSYLTPSLREAIDRHLRIRVESGTCRDWAAKWVGHVKPPGRKDAHVTAVHVMRGLATVTVQAAPDLQSEVRLRRQGSAWLIDNY